MREYQQQQQCISDWNKTKDDESEKKRFISFVFCHKALFRLKGFVIVAFIYAI